MKTITLLITICCSSILFSQTVVLSPDIDNAMFSESTNSSGAGQIYSGRTNSGNDRRALMSFDVAGSIPAGATITSVSLDLNIDQAPSFAAIGIFDLHPVTTEWGEGTSIGSGGGGGGGSGGTAVAPDATWLDAMLGTSAWTSAGGDFGASSAQTSTSIGTGTFTWTSAQMVTDVQGWLDTPGSNFGWILIGDETSVKSARRFGSKEQGTAPQLTINYTCTDPPIALCQDINVFLDGAGSATINDSDLDNGSAPVCGTSVSFSASQTAFSCADILVAPAEDLAISAIYDGPITGGVPKGIELYVINDIADLSEYGVGSATNGGGTDGEEFTFPTVSVTAGTYIYVSSEATGFTNFFGFAPDYTTSSMGVNGDDAVELFHNGAVIDTYGDINVLGDGEPWDYTDGWAYRINATGPDGSAFTVSNWTYSGINALDGESTNGGAANPVPIGTYVSGLAPGPTAVTLTVTDDNLATNTCIAMVSVLDTLPPVMDCVGSMTIVLNSTGDTTLLATDLDNATADNCGLDTLYLSQYDFDCSSAGLNQVTLYGEDDYGNVDSCTVDITIDHSAVITVVLDSVVDASCQGVSDGGVYISHSGGTLPITYDWDNDGIGDNDDSEDLTAVGAGPYLVSVTDANGCSAQINSVVNEPSTLTFSSVWNDVTCFGMCDGSITISASSGPVTYSNDNGLTFQASNVFIGLCAGVYDILVDDGSACQATGSVFIVEPPQITLTIENDTICLGNSDGELELLATGGIAPYMYSLDGNVGGPFTNLAIGTYTGMAVDANGCLSSSISADVVEAPSIDVTVSGLDTSVYTANETGATYQWIRCEDSTAIAGATDQYYDLSVHGGQGEIAVIVTSAFGCSDTSECLPTEFVTINQIDGHNISLFPNPVSDELNISIDGNSELIQLRVLDMNGRLVFNTSTSNAVSSIDMSAFENGVYLVEFVSAESRLTQRIVVRH